MQNQAGVQGAASESKQNLKAQLAQYVEQQSESTQAFHRWMKRLEVASVGIIIAVFIAALYVSINWKSVPPMLIPVAWFLFVASASPAMVLVGLHSVILHAFPPIVLPGKQQKFVTGSQAVWTGWALVAGGVVAAAFWGLFAYAVGTFNLAMLTPLINLLGVVISVAVVVSVLAKLFQQITKSR